MSTTSFSLSLISLNYSETCQPMQEDDISTLMNFYYTVGLILGPVNAISNGACVHIFKHPLWKKSAMSAILKALSIFEICLGICLFINAILYLTGGAGSSTGGAALSQEDDYAYIRRIINFCLTIAFSRGLAAFQIARNWSVVLLAAYRYDRICRPVGASTALPRKRISAIMILVCILSFIFVIPRLFESGIVICRIDGSVAGATEILVNSTHYQVIYIGAVMFIAQSGGPVICVCVLSAFVIRLIVKRRRMHETKRMTSATARLFSQQMSTARPVSEINCSKPTVDGSFEQFGDPITAVEPDLDCNATSTGVLNNEHPEEGNNFPAAPIALSPDLISKRPPPSGDKLIFAVCITFFVLETPAFFSKILQSYLERDYREVDQIFSVIANLLIYLDSMLNAIVYMASNPTFRKVVSQEVTRLRTNAVSSKSERSTRCQSGTVLC